MDLFFSCPVLKVVENLGVSYVRGTDVYKSKLVNELRKLKFPYKVSRDQDTELSCTLFSLYHSRIMNKSRGDEMLFLKLQFCPFVKRCSFALKAYIYYFRVPPSSISWHLLSKRLLLIHC